MTKYILKTENMSKSFFGVSALDNINLSIQPCEILGLVGANGAGKSTLLKIIGGVHSPDEGHVLLEDSTITEFTPGAAQNSGIITVYQELNLFCEMTVAENLFMGSEPRNKAGLINWRIINRKSKQVLDELCLQIKPGCIVASLSVAQQQLIEFAKAVMKKPKVLLLDEPTAALSKSEIEWLFAKVRELAKQGTTIIYVSHRLDEIVELCPRVAVLRDGKLVVDVNEGITRDNIVRYMIGHDLISRSRKTAMKKEELLLECKGISSEERVRDVDLTLHRGEILGIAGLMGSGRSELLRTIFGAEPLTAGSIYFKGRPLKSRSTKAAIEQGIVLVPEDRKTEGLIMEETTQYNIALGTLEERHFFGLIDRRGETAECKEIAAKVKLDTKRLADPVRTLSGGNQQKAVMGKWTLSDAEVFLLDEPTRGVDVGAREEIYRLIKDLVTAGKSVILVSSEWEEILDLCDRVLVMSEGKITGEFSAEEANQEKIMHLATPMSLINSDCTQRDAEQLSKWVELKQAFQNKLPSLLLGALFVGIIMAASLLTETFATSTNASNLVRQGTTLALLTIGQMVVIIAGGIDLSQGALLTVAAVIGAGMMANDPSKLLPGILLILGIGLLVGTINGFLVVKARMDSFIATLGMMTILQGTALIYTRRAVGPVPFVLRRFINDDFFGIPNALFILGFFMLVFILFLKYTPSGRRMFAVGQNLQSAHQAGISVNTTRFLSYIVVSLMSALAALFYIGRAGAAEPLYGPGLELEAIAAALIGGTALKGGRGTVWGAVGGVAVLIVLINMLNLIGVYIWYQQIIRGVMVLLILIIYQQSMGGKQSES